MSCVGLPDVGAVVALSTFVVLWLLPELVVACKLAT
jgi:hypothetical protein